MAVSSLRIDLRNFFLNLGLVCPVCMMGWMSKRLLREHVIVSHGSDWIRTPPSGPLAYQCRHCNQFFWRASECHSHEKEEHAEMNTVQCHICSETMLRKVCLKMYQFLIKNIMYFLFQFLVVLLGFKLNLNHENKF